MLQCWKYGILDAPRAQLLLDRIGPLKTQDALGQLEPFRKPKSFEGELRLDRQSRIPLDYLRAGLLMAMGTGSGKTNLLCHLAIQLAATKTRFWAVENYKTQLRHLRRPYQAQGREMVVLRPQDWDAVNPLDPGSLDPRLHLSMAADLRTRTLDLPSLARTILWRGVEELYRKFNIFDGGNRCVPCLIDLYEWVRSTEGLNPQSRESILQRLGAVLSGLNPRAAACRRAWRVDELSRHDIIFELRGASETGKSCFAARNRWTPPCGTN